MAETQGSKRARANTAGDAHANQDENQVSAEKNSRRLREYVHKLDRETLAAIVTIAADKHPDVTAMVDHATRKLFEKEQNRVLNFDHYSGSIWKSINITDDYASGSEQYQMAFDVVEEVNSTVEHIAKQCDSFANPKTRFNGLSVLRKFGKTIALSGDDTLGHEVQKNFQHDRSLENGMLKIVSAMKPEERRGIRQDQSSSESLWPKLQELQRLGKEYCLFAKLGEVLDLLDGKGAATGECEDGENDGDEQYGEDEEDEGNEGHRDWQAYERYDNWDSYVDWGSDGAPP